MKNVVVIPARLDSSRFPNKILLNIHGLPMIEHVRRRALLAKNVDEVYVATCDEEIREVLEKFGAKVIMTSNLHRNGTTRVAEAITSIECSKVILLQGDEPLILPENLDLIVEKIKYDNDFLAWNATGPIKNEEELNRHSFVKCALFEDRILYCFRKSPSFNSFSAQLTYTRKVLGLIAYTKDFLIKISSMSSTPIEECESIEQMRIIENGFSIRSIDLELSQPSINEPHEVNDVLNYFKNNRRQGDLLKEVLNYINV